MWFLVQNRNVPHLNSSIWYSGLNLSLYLRLTKKNKRLLTNLEILDSAGWVHRRYHWPCLPPGGLPEEPGRRQGCHWDICGSDELSLSSSEAGSLNTQTKHLKPKDWLSYIRKGLIQICLSGKNNQIIIFSFLLHKQTIFFDVSLLIILGLGLWLWVVTWAPWSKKKGNGGKSYQKWRIYLVNAK